MARTLVVTNDYPPRPGGIQAFVQAMVDGFTPSEVVVYASTWRGHADECARYDREKPYLTVRDKTTVMIPDPVRVRRAVDIAKAEGCDRVWFGAAAPLALMAPSLRRQAGVERLVATTHGHEAGWAALPGARGLLRRIGDGVDVVTYLGNYFHTRLAPVLADRTELVRLAPGVDTDAFHPDLDGSGVRARYGLTDRPVIVCVSRLVPRKGQDMLIRALPEVRRRVPDAALLIVSGGPYGDSLRRLARDTGVADHVVFTGEVAWPEVPLHFEIVHEDASLLAVNKPSGLPSEPAGGFLENTLLALVRARDPAWTPVHRLGRGTSGLVLFARGGPARSALTAALRERRVEKVYRALAGGSLIEPVTVEVPIGPVAHPKLGELFAASAEGRPARSHVRPLAARAT